MFEAEDVDRIAMIRWSGDQVRIVHVDGDGEVATAQLLADGYTVRVRFCYRISSDGVLVVDEM